MKKIMFFCTILTITPAYAELHPAEDIAGPAIDACRGGYIGEPCKYTVHKGLEAEGVCRDSGRIEGEVICVPLKLIQH